MQHRQIVMLALLAAYSLTASAQTTRSDSEFVAQSIVLDRCILSKPSATSDDMPRHPESLSLATGTFLAGIAGDMVAAGANALGAALEEASREKGFSAAASTSFTYYHITRQDLQDNELPRLRLEPRLREVSSICLIVSYRGAASKLAPPTPTELAALSLDDGTKKWRGYGLPESPDVYVEAELQQRNDGFLLRPVLVWYRGALPGAPKKASATEFHAAFSVPAAPAADASAGQVFAVARVRLPNLAPGSVLGAAALIRHTSLIIPSRATTGSPAELLQRTTQVVTDSAANMKLIVETKRALEYAEKAASQPGASAETKAKVTTLELQLLGAEDAAIELKGKLKALKDETFPIEAGSTNVQARFTVIRDANKFGLALAAALKSRSTALGTAVTAQLTPAAQAPAWTTNDTTYVTAMSAVETAQRALDIATASGDEGAIFEKRLALKNAKAAANAAAAASNRALPFPGLI